MMKQARPRTTSAATELLERYAELAGQSAAIETIRGGQLAEINAASDKELLPILDEMAGIEATIAPWWAKNAEKLTEGKRKSIELGGCMIGSRAGSATLGYDGAEKSSVAALQGARWAKPLIRVTASIDKAATLKALTGPNKVKLAALGFKKVDEDESFFVKRVEQGGTIGS